MLRHRSAPNGPAESATLEPAPRPPWATTVELIETPRRMPADRHNNTDVVRLDIKPFERSMNAIDLTIDGTDSAQARTELPCACHNDEFYRRDATSPQHPTPGCPHPFPKSDDPKPHPFGAAFLVSLPKQRAVEQGRLLQK